MVPSSSRRSFRFVSSAGSGHSPSLLVKSALSRNERGWPTLNPIPFNQGESELPTRRASSSSRNTRLIFVPPRSRVGLRLPAYLAVMTIETIDSRRQLGVERCMQLDVGHFGERFLAFGAEPGRSSGDALAADRLLESEGRRHGP